MPRTISTKPQYSIQWWADRALAAPERNSFEVLRTMLRYRLKEPVPALRGSVKLCDARVAARAFPLLKERLSLVVTSPPYLDTTDYTEDQWLRLWFLGGSEKPRTGANKDDRHTDLDSYWSFLEEAWSGIQPLVRRGTHVVVRIGGTKVAKEDLLAGLSSSLGRGLSGYKVKPRDAGETTEIRNRQTNVFRPGTSTGRVEHDFTFKVTA